MKIRYILVFLLLINLTFADSPGEKILLVADAHYDFSNDDLLPYYTPALDYVRKYQNVEYDIYIVDEEDDNGPDYTYMKNYDIVIWFTGNDFGGAPRDYPTLTSADQNNLSKYLENGGKLFITGQDIGYDLAWLGNGISFYENYLHADYIQDDIDEDILLGVTNDPIGSGLIINISGGARNQHYPSVIEPRDVYGTNIFTYEGWIITRGGPPRPAPGAIKVNTGGPNGYKVVYFAFGFEGISGVDKRNNIMKRIIGYLGAPSTKRTKIYVRDLDDLGWEDFNITCDPLDTYCLRKKNPKVNATCISYQLFSNITGAEYFINSVGQGNGTNMSAADSNFSSHIEIVNASVNVSALSDGIYTINVHCKDSDNYWGKFDNYSFEVDNIPPIFSGNGILLERDYTNEEKPNIEITVLPAYEPDYMQFSCNNQNWTSWVPYQQTYSNFNITDPNYGCNLSDGNRTVYVRIRDRAGNLGTDSSYNILYPHDWIVLDRISPKVNLIYPQANEWLNTTSINFTFNFTDVLSPKANCSIYIDIILNQTNSTTLNNTNTNFLVSNLAEGQHTWNITCIDLAGNLNSSRGTFSIDITPPDITIENPKEGYTYSGIVNLLTTISDFGVGIDKAWYKIVNSTNLSQVFAEGNLSEQSGWDATWNSSEITNSTGNFTFIVYANDSLGWLSSKNISFKVDNNKPSATIVFPKKIYLNYNFNLSLKAERPNGNITNASYWIYNSSNDLIANNTTQPNLPSFEFTDFINISTWNDGNYTIVFNVTDGTNNASDSSWFFIDKTPPNLTNWNLNIETDTNYNDKRIFKGEEVTFSVNVSEEVTLIDKVIATVILPNSYAYNYSLSPENNNYTEDKWKFSFSPSLFGIYNITKIFANDTLGNLNEIEINLSFIVVRPSLKLNFGENNEIDATLNATFNLTFNFNKTVSNQNLILYIPSYYLNLTSWSCTNCSLIGKNQLNLTTNENITSIKLQTNLLAGTPEQDLNSTWYLEFRGENYTDETKIRTPYLNISVLCDGNSNCTVNQTEVFNLTITVENIQDVNHTGTSYSTTLNFSCQVFLNSSFLGNIGSGSSTTKSWTEVIESPGTYNCTFNVSDKTGNYTKQLKKMIIVKDITLPIFLGRSWTESNFISDTNTSINKSFNQNETIKYFVKAEDNIGINNIIIEVYNGNYTNRSLSLDVSYGEYEIWKFVNKSDELGIYNITKIYINDTSGNIIEINLTDYYEIIELKLNSSLTNRTILINNTQTFLANVSGNASAVSEVRANIVVPSGVVDSTILSLQDSFYKGTYIPKKSGNYFVNITVILSSGINKTDHLNFSVPYGNISINTKEEIILIENTTYNLPIFIVPDNGDLINVTINISIENESVVNSTNKSKTIGDVYWIDYYQGKDVYFLLNSTQIGNTVINITAFSPNLNKSASKIINVTVIQNDTSPPIIHNFTISYNITNLNEINKFIINTTENETEIKTVLVEITWPSNYTTNITATLNPNNLYELDFNGTNETGIYKSRIYSCNLVDVCTNTITREFNVTNTYDVFTFISGSNKGSTVEFNVSVKNVRGEEVEDFNLTLVIYNTEKNITVVNNTQTNYASYRIRYDDPPKADYYNSLSKNYISYVHVEKNGNSGTTSKNFIVSEDLETTIIYPDTKYYPPNTPVNLSVEVRDFDNNIVETASVIAYCPDCSKKYARLVYNSSTKKYTGYNIISPSKDFSIFIFSSSYFGGNKGYTATTLLTSQLTESETSGGGGGGTAGVINLTIPNCTCTEWEDKGCGMGTCELSEMYQVRVCTPSGCANETQCIFSPECIPEKNFDIFLSEQELKIEQGETAKIFLNLINTGEDNLSIFIDVNKKCCEINFTNYVELKKKEKVSLPIIIHAKLSQTPGDFSITFIAKSDQIKKKVSLRLIIENNILISYISNVRNELPIIERQIIKFDKLGIDVADLYNKIEEIKYWLKEANKSIYYDNLTALEIQSEKIKTNFEYIKLQIIALKIQEFLLENWEYLVALLIFTLILLYYITQVIWPYIKLKREIKELKKKGEDLLETRRATEKQFFMRKMDEPTFRAVLSKTQQQILKNRSEIKNKLAELSLLKKKVNPILMIKWILLLPISVLKKINSKLQKIKKKIKLYFKTKEIEKEFVNIK
jgi:hypothetical protein